LAPYPRAATSKIIILIIRTDTVYGLEFLDLIWTEI